MAGWLIVRLMNNQIDSLQVDEHFEMRKLLFGTLDEVHHLVEQVDYIELDSFDLKLLESDRGKPEE